LALIVFFILAIIISAGGIGPRKIGFEYWHNPGAFADSINGVAKTFVVAGTLYAGTEMYVFEYRRSDDSVGANNDPGLVSQPESLQTHERQCRKLSSKSFGAS
jgi:hypothetical protein